MNVFISGASGLVGSHLVPVLESAGHQVTRLVRREPMNRNERNWDTAGRRMSATILEGCEALVHLSGEPVVGLRWTQAKRAAIHESRVNTTQVLVDAIQRMTRPPKCFVVASAIGYYKESGDTVLTEQSPAGDEFLSEVCQDWEETTDPIRELTRVTNVRTGMVLSPKGGALRAMLPAFRLGLGGPIGSGKQYWSWISAADIASIYRFCIETTDLHGPVNGVAPGPVTNQEFTDALGRALNRPAVMRVPAFAVKWGLGEMGHELLLASRRVVPEVALQRGFSFQHSTIHEAFSILSKKKQSS
ncbi:TIGR01777 family oxidoreductase [Planctomicrobium sp. SH527]|uniref:TIGR01777 family oxidoreductase n=1 Tax=Planctomicrobium sp. SH527 TaxID=3448123 RepID=UPI003F5BC3EE